ncbi:HD domain-containing protein [Phyllobacterium sp. LjRoot231]|uniref:HD domain-containing protein n=1 Tax=Phyllobacterium sp. LjRoot231 TaxID=3342289 RepID=UPI003ECC3603
MTIAAFAPYQTLAESLLPYTLDGSSDGSHDLSHLLRVWKNTRAIQAMEGGDQEILVAATILHDCVGVEKNSPLRAQASRLAAEKASRVLIGLGWSSWQFAVTTHAIEAHSFSAGVKPTTLEAKIVQDADRLDAIGMVGVARCFYIAGRMGSGLYDPADPEALDRAFDDKRFAIDHFQTKLFKLAAGFNTEAGARIAQMRQERLRRFFDEFLDEI